MDSKATKSSEVAPPKSGQRSVVEIRQHEARDANKRLKKFEEEQEKFEQELQKRSETLKLNDQRIKDVRSTACLIKRSP